MQIDVILRLALAFGVLAGDLVYEYEKAHLRDGAWEPTSWYAEWVSGVDVFALERKNCPVVMHWLVCEKAN